MAVHHSIPPPLQLRAQQQLLLLFNCNVHFWEVDTRLQPIIQQSQQRHGVTFLHCVSTCTCTCTCTCDVVHHADRAVHDSAWRASDAKFSLHGAWVFGSVGSSCCLRLGASTCTPSLILAHCERRPLSCWRITTVQCEALPCVASEASASAPSP